MGAFDYWWKEIGSGILPRRGDDMEEHAKRVCFEFYCWLVDDCIDSPSGERSYNADGTLPMQPEPEPYI